jgi:hypothetical protein
MRVTIKAKTSHDIGLYGYFDLTASIQRDWGKNPMNRATWRHITIGLRSPILYCPKHFGWKWFPLRFGYGQGNVYLGLVYIVTTFGRQGGEMEYRNFGPITWASVRA